MTEEEAQVINGDEIAEKAINGLEAIRDEDLITIASGKRPKHIDYDVYRALRKTIDTRTKNYLKGTLFYNSGRGIQKVTDKEADLPAKDGSGIKFVKATPYVKPKNKEVNV